MRDLPELDADRLARHLDEILSGPNVQYRDRLDE